VKRELSLPRFHVFTFHVSRFPMFTPKDILLGALLPLIIAAGVRWILRRPWADSIALTAAFIVGYLGIAGWNKIQKFPPLEPNDYLLFLPVPVMILSGWHGRWARVLLIPWAGLASYFLLHLPGQALSAVVPPTLLWAGVIFLYTLSFDSLTDHFKDLSLPLIALATSAITALVLLLSDSQTFGQFGGALTMSLLGICVIAWWLGSPGLSHFSAFFLGTLLPGLVLVWHTYAGLTFTHAVLLLAAPHLLWIGKLPFLSRRKPWQRILIALILAMIPLAAAAISAGLTFVKASAEGKSY
jgi:hypothetical protein